ncbi:MAG TPA: conjugal transfer protein TraB [Desulfobacteraceae bacterium]|nr:MAG: conjugal transfer protein TraB [Methanophagales archaeon]HDI79207.1 conjugal transfer protein TraB [Desulfobacteraceae bacterium]
MKSEDELALRVTKEIIIKLIEMGRVSVNNFDQVFKQIHTTVFESLTQKGLRIDNLE